MKSTEVAPANRTMTATKANRSGLRMAVSSFVFARRARDSQMAARGGARQHRAVRSIGLDAETNQGSQIARAALFDISQGWQKTPRNGTSVTGLGDDATCS